MCTCICVLKNSVFSWVGGCFSVFNDFVFPWVSECALLIVQFPCFFAQRVAAQSASKEAQARSGCHYCCASENTELLKQTNILKST